MKSKRDKCKETEKVRDKNGWTGSDSLQQLFITSRTTFKCISIEKKHFDLSKYMAKTEESKRIRTGGIRDHSLGRLPVHHGGS